MFNNECVTFRRVSSVGVKKLPLDSDMRRGAPSRVFLPLAWMAIAVLLPWCFARPVFGAPLTFSVEERDGIRAVAVDAREVQGIMRVSLFRLAGDLGGAVRSTSTQVVVAFGEVSAAVGLNNNRVEVPPVSFLLQHPVIREQQDALIAVADVERFFSQAFGRRVRLTDNTPARPTPAEDRVGVRELSDVSRPAPIAEPMPLLPEEGTETAAGVVEPHLQTPLSPIEDTSAPSPAALPPRRSPGIVIIDPGHGGNDAGCVGQGGLFEKDVTLKVAQALRRVLKETTTLSTFITRTDDRAMTSNDRANFANQQHGNLLISIHAGASYTAQAHGIEIFYPGPEDREITGTSAGDQGAVSETSRQAADEVARATAEVCSAALRGVHEARIRVLQTAVMPGCLIEIGCLTNPAEEALLQTDAYCEKVAQGIAAGLGRMLQGAAAPGTSP